MREHSKLLSAVRHRRQNHMAGEHLDVLDTNVGILGDQLPPLNRTDDLRGALIRRRSGASP